MHHRMHDVFLPGTHFQVVTSIIVLIAILMINLLCRIPIIKKMFCRQVYGLFFTYFSVRGQRNIVIRGCTPDPRFDDLSVPPILGCGITDISSDTSNSTAGAYLINSLVMMNIFPNFFLVHYRIYFLYRIIALTVWRLTPYCFARLFWEAWPEEYLTRISSACPLVSLAFTLFSP